GNPLSYARALARLEELRGAPALALSATGGSLFARVRRLAQGGKPAAGPAARGVTAAAVLSGVMIALATQSFTAHAARVHRADPPMPALHMAVTDHVARQVETMTTNLVTHTVEHTLTNVLTNTLGGDPVQAPARDDVAAKSTDDPDDPATDDS